MKRYVGVLVGIVAFAGSIVSMGIVEAGGGGHYVCGAASAPVSYDKAHYAEVSITDNCFGPVVARVAPGTEVRWINRGYAIHNIADVTKPTTQPSMLQAGATLSMKFNDPGAFIYHCSIHPGMMGVLFVGDDASQNLDGELVASDTSASVLPLKAMPADPSVVSVPSAREGMAPQTVVLLALAVGLVAGGGSTMLVRKLDRS